MRRLGCWSPGHDNHVAGFGGHSYFEAPGGAYAAFGAVADHGAAQTGPGYYSQARLALDPWRLIDDHRFKIANVACRTHAPEVAPFTQTTEFVQETPRSTPGSGRGLFAGYAVSRTRPLRRRRRIMARPDRDPMRCRNPWRRFRRLTFGWYVRFICLSSLDYPGRWPRTRPITTEYITTAKPRANAEKRLRGEAAPDIRDGTPLPGWSRP